MQPIDDTDMIVTTIGGGEGHKADPYWIQADLDAAVEEQTEQGAKRLDEAWAEYRLTLSPEEDLESTQALGEY